MIWPDTPGVSTQVIDGGTRGDRSNEQFIRHSMCPLLDPSSIKFPIEQTVTIGVKRPAPDPTTWLLLDLRLETLLDISGSWAMRHTTNYTLIGARLLEQMESVA